LREIAHRTLAGARPATLETTDLVHEVYLKLVDQTGATWRDRAHFLALASVAMRHILIGRARARQAFKRGGARQRVSLDGELIAAEDQAASLIDIDDALIRLAEVEPRLARVVEYRFFGGLDHEEIAEVLQITVRTVERDWAKAKMLLRHSLAP
jgi:RNA polymerase sigma factor (TIGR02999 family)